MDARMWSARMRLAGLFLVLGFGAGSAAGPPTLDEVLEAKPDERKVLAFRDERRQAAMRDAAISYGMQSGLARREFELGRMMERYGRELDRVYRFDRLVISQDGFLVAPPVVVETTEAFRRNTEGDRAVTARRVLRIERQAEVLGSAPGWRRYFDREWKAADPPSEVLFPRTREEERLWRGWVREGWADGKRLADETFASDLDRLDRDFNGIVTWRILEAQQMVTAPELEVRERAVVGGGTLMRVGERELVIRARARLNPVSEDWRAIEEAPWPH